MLFDLIYFNGCSFTAGGGLEIRNEGEIGVFCSDGYKQKYGLKWKHNKDVSYPQRVSEILNIPIINDAIQGGSFDRVQRTTYDFIANYKGDIKRVLFFLEIPPGLRLDIYSNYFSQFILCNGYVENGVAKMAGQRSYEALSYNDDKQFIDKSLANMFENHFSLDYYLKKQVLDYNHLVHYFNRNQINLIITPSTIETILRETGSKEDKNFTNRFGINQFNPNFKSVHFIESSQGFCAKINSLIHNELDDILDENKKPYNDAHPGYYGHISYAKFVVEFINKIFY